MEDGRRKWFGRGVVGGVCFEGDFVDGVGSIGVGVEMVREVADDRFGVPFDEEAFAVAVDRFVGVVEGFVEVGMDV